MQGKAHITLVQTYLKYATEIFAEDSALKAKSEALCALKCQAFLTSTLKSEKPGILKHTKLHFSPSMRYLLRRFLLRISNKFVRG